MKKKHLCLWVVMLIVSMTCTIVYVKADANPLGKLLSEFPFSRLASPASDEATEKVPESLSLDDLPSGWNSEYDSSTHTITYLEEWGGKGWWLGDQDASDYAYFVVEFATPTLASGNVLVQSTDGNSIGDGFFDIGCTKKVLPISDGSEHLQEIFIQGGSAGISFVLQAAYFTNKVMEDEYGTPKVVEQLSLGDLASGSNSEYDSSTHAITISDDWGSRGWWLKDQDASDYAYFVVEFATPTSTYGKVVAETVDDISTGDDGFFDANCTKCVIALPSGSDHLKQIYIQGPYSGAQFVLQAAYFTNEEMSDEYADAQVSQDEWQILKDFYDSVDNTEEWNETWDFSAGYPHIEGLGGVGAEGGHIKSICLNFCHLKHFPSALLSLPYLERLELYTNDMNDNLTELAEILPENTVLKYLDIDTNQLTGNVGLFASRFPNLETLDARRNKIDKVSPMISPNVYVYLDGQALDQKIDINIAKNTPEEIREQLPEILLYNHGGQEYDNYPCFYFESNENSFCLNMSEDGFSVSGSQDYKGSIRDVYDLDAGNGKLKGTIVFDQGDGNFDGDVNVLDLQADINHILGEYYYYNAFNFTAANLWDDDQINVQDVVPLVNLLMEKKSAGKTIFYESFDQCEGVGGNDGQWDGTDDSEEVVTDNSEWALNHCAGANQCMRVGESYWNGDAFSPNLELDGQAVLCFRAAAGVGDNTHLAVSLYQYDEDNGYDFCLKSEDVELHEGNWTEYEVQIEGHGRIYIGFTGGNCYLDDVKIVQIKDKSKVLRRVFAKTNPDATLTVCDGNLVINTTKPVAAFDIVVDGATSMKVANQLKQRGFTTEEQKQGNAVHLIGYSLSGATLPIGETVLGTVQKGATVSRAMLSDSKAKEIVVGFSGTPTSITQPAASDTQQPASEVYRLPVSSKKAIIFDSKGKKTLKDIAR